MSGTSDNEGTEAAEPESTPESESATDATRPDLTAAPDTTPELGRPRPNLKPPPPEVALRETTRSGAALHLLLFVVTFLSAVLAYTLSHIGAPSVRDGLAWIATEPSLLAIGVPFAATLMAILLAHEMGHYLTAKKAGVDQSLPYFIPAPTIFGTLGALILMRSQPRDRASLLDVAVMGPYAGLLLAIPATIWGLTQSSAESIEFLDRGDIIFGDSLLFGWLRFTFGPQADVVDLHPVAVAGWVGLFVTSLNLIPAAQLDGGHVAYALFGHRQERVSTIVVAILFGLGLYLGFPRGSVWMFWALFLFIIGLKHPPVRDETMPLPVARRLNGWVALLIFVVTFTPVPIDVVTAELLGQAPQQERPFPDPHERFDRQRRQQESVPPDPIDEPLDEPLDEGEAEEFRL